jgi:hypothetical protein
MHGATVRSLARISENYPSTHSGEWADDASSELPAPPGEKIGNLGDALGTYPR